MNSFYTKLMRSVIVVAFLITIPFVKPSATESFQAIEGYPYSNPILATLSTVLMRGENPKPWQKTYTVENHALSPLEGRRSVHLLGERAFIDYRFYRAGRDRPLVFLIPGFGATRSSGYSNYYATMLARQGVNAVILSSPFHWKSLLSRSSTGFPFPEDDAKDLYQTMRDVLSDIERTSGWNFKSLRVAGFSLGALHAGFLKRVHDQSENPLPIDKFLLVHPPVDLVSGARSIDRFYEHGAELSGEELQEAGVVAMAALSQALRLDIDDPAYFDNLEKRVPLNNDQIQFLIGREMRRPIRDAIWTLELLHEDLDNLETPIYRGRQSKSLAEAATFSVAEFIERLVWPELQRRFFLELSFPEIRERASLFALQETLSESPNLYLFHAQDDFILAEGHLRYLEETFGDRAFIFEKGGHMGELWHSPVLNRIISLLSSDNNE